MTTNAPQTPTLNKGCARMVLSLFTILFCALFLEIFLRLFVPEKPPFVNEGYLPWIAYDPVIGWVNRPGFEGRQTITGKFDVAIRINSQGLRGPECAYARTPGKKRVLVIGDSFTFGHGAEERDVFTTRLAALLPGTEVLNGAVVGWGHDQQLLWLEREGLKYQPDLVVWAFSSADIPRNTVYFRRMADPRTALDYAKPRYLLEAGKLVLTNVPTIPPEGVAEAVAQLEARRAAARPALVRGLCRSRLFRRIYDWIADLRERREQMVLARAITTEFIRVARLNKIPIVFVYIPVEKWLTKNNPMVALKRAMALNLAREVCAAEGVECLDLTPYFKKVGPDSIHSLFIPDDGHYSPAGHELVARVLAEKMKTNLTPGR